MRCEIACVSEHSPGTPYRAEMPSRPESEQKTRIFIDSAGGGKAVPLVCRHCADPQCLAACMAGCMQKDPETGVVTNEGHEQKCVGCWMCIMACPFGVINMVNATASLHPSAAHGAEENRAVKCDFCPARDTPACIDACPNQALHIVSVEERS